MSDILRSPNGNAILLVPRSGSNSLALAAMGAFWPQIEVLNIQHPAWYFGVQEIWKGDNPNVGVILRNPIERFRSMIAKHQLDVEQQLINPLYAPIIHPNCLFIRYFKFETELNVAAQWLGLPTPLAQVDASDEAFKPILNQDQEAKVREIFAADIALWESL